MSKDHIYKLLSHFYGLLVNDFPKTGLVTKGIYVKSVNFQLLWTRSKKAIEFHLQMKRLEYWRTLRKRFVPFKNFSKEATIFLLNCELLIEEVFYV